MPHHFEFDAERKILLVIVEGEVTNHELQKIYDDIKGLAGKLVASAGIMDLSEVTTLAVDSFTIRFACRKTALIARRNATLHRCTKERGLRDVTYV